ncbi:MAG: UDP-N-acetylmuramoyl-L-alanyl-D-glutamate--2,6-diaminopimelate ligase [Actinomycetota bacterium]
MPTPDRRSAERGPRPGCVPRPSRSAGRTLADLHTLLGRPGDPPAADVLVTGVTLDSRAVRPGDLYAALPGARAHGADFAGQAAAAGAVACLTDPAGATRAAGSGLPLLVVDDPRARLGGLAAAVYGDPASRLLLLGVTGTNGKTTTTYLLDAALRAAGHLTGLVGTVETRVGNERLPSVRTTPEAPDVHALLALMLERGVTACAMEVSSHALALHRVDGVVYDVAGFTNLSQDHLDFHHDMADYFAAKASLFTPERARRGVVCVDDEWGRRLVERARVPVVTVTTRPDVEADWSAGRLEVAASGATTAFALRGRGGREYRLTSPLPGEFNVANTALTFVMLLEAGLDAGAAARGLALAAGVPGRMERVQSSAPDEPLALVDYAHTPDALAAALRALRPSTRGRLVVVLGAGGDRDPSKRPAMGEAAAAHADLVVVTDDNPRSEDPAAIRAAVLEGARRAAAASGAEVVEVADRAQAVAAAVAATAGRADTVLVAGKGHETGQEVAGTVHPFDDREVLRRALERWADRTRQEADA